jgi:hypothetical protein
VKSIHLINAILALSLFCILSSELGLSAGLSLEARRATGLIAIGTNMAIGILGAITSYRLAWSAYLVLSVAGLVLVGAATPIFALWLALKLL